MKKLGVPSPREFAGKDPHDSRIKFSISLGLALLFIQERWRPPSFQVLSLAMWSK